MKIITKIMATVPKFFDPSTLSQIWVWVNTYRYIFNGMNIHKSQLFWGSLGTRVLTHSHLKIIGTITGVPRGRAPVRLTWCHSSAEAGSEAQNDGGLGAPPSPNKYGDGSKPWHLVNIKIAGKWMFIPLKMLLIGIDPYPY